MCKGRALAAYGLQVRKGTSMLTPPSEAAAAVIKQWKMLEAAATAAAELSLGGQAVVA